MPPLKLKQTLIVLAHAAVIWALCGAIIGLGRLITSMQTILIIHLIGAPVLTFLIAAFYFRKFNYTSPLRTAIIFLSFVILLDAGLVAPFFEKNFIMFTSITGTWLPFVLIFISTFFTGLAFRKSN